MLISRDFVNIILGERIGTTLFITIQKSNYRIKLLIIK